MAPWLTKQGLLTAGPPRAPMVQAEGAPTALTPS